MLPVGMLLILAMLIAVLLRLWTTRSKASIQEPPCISSRLPLIGHLLGLYRYGSDYFFKLDRGHRHGLYSIHLGQKCMYIAASPGWAQAVHRAQKTLHFNTLLVQAVKHIFCLDERSMQIFEQNCNGDDGTRSGYVPDVHHQLSTMLGHGQQQDDINANILKQLCICVNSLAAHGPEKARLWTWVRRNMFMATVAPLWGSSHPFDYQTEAAFWNFESNLLALGGLPFPHLLVRKAYNSREQLFSALERYLDEEGYLAHDTSPLIKERAKLALDQYGWTKQMHARAELSIVFGAMTNSIPAMFWLVSYIFADRALLTEIRAEVDNCITTAAAGERTISATALRTSCPLLSSTLRETLRMVGSVHLYRHVTEDTTLKNTSTGETYLLREGSLVQIASNVIHQHELWGDEPDVFDPRRFLCTGRQTSSNAQDPAAPFHDQNGKIHSAAFRAFGSGKDVCPGRHFAHMSLIGFAALLVAGFEIEGLHTPGKYEMPSTESFKTGVGVTKPARDVVVKIERRAGYENARWSFEL